MNKRILIPAALLLAVTLTACSDSGKEGAQESGQRLTEQAFSQQQAAVPYPADQLTDSLERRNLKERLLRQNDPDKIGYVYILSFGKFIGYYTIKGKVSSTQSQMTTDTLLIDVSGDGDRTRYAVSAPGDDGSYGENEDGVFFFTTEGAMVQVSTEYIYSDEPVAVGDIPELNGTESD